MRNKQKGFSLIELLIVVAIILIIAAIAIPNLLRARISANEASAASSLRTMNTACITYNSTYGVYPATQTVLGPANGATPTSTLADLLDIVLAPASGAAVKSGYTITYATPGANVSASATAGQVYTITAIPVVENQTGIRTFFTEQDGVIRADATGGTPTFSSTPLQ
jgi:prepilin-type N-terminal cleavage/methylation domain-containing protein